ncbi:UDP-N-acetylmuramoyl-tripeptide--D-alanyl-D-alanine ligase [Chondrinema litorale]|uniref:UDP-N-acetylmuramoyl-tripeptide--D-alanyl-D- alanine ligase n=1 Tax=Chondrinema litorale TaxID=2994555 RepID=UPI002542CAF5|nr:UDP-N-acetylmuramoyl-tripeptide--D-alanyl-D-alanine ligase [Chondrinema litorale]UZR94516.1 UDP-N-acetylmuramoyl-tripeptide--D-alanyl-D-alanine ligase [Chondrinema litorale]
MQTEALYQLYKQHPIITTDTRKIEHGSLFFALKGPRFNGNEYATEALQKGAEYAVVDEIADENKANEKLILVDDVLTSLQQLANHHRNQMKIPVIAITGSNGKTTTKELLYQVLSKNYKTFATPGNFNNHIGLPITILQTPAGTEMLILEMGDNSLGEVDALCKIANPDLGLITNIGKDHLEGFGSFENNIRAKSELFNYLIQNGGNAFIPSKDDILFNMSKRFKEPILYGKEGNFSYLKFNEESVYVSFETENENTYQSKLFGAFNFANIEAAWCIGKYFNIPESLLSEAVCNYAPTNNRSQIVEKGTNTLLLDAYNANPSSVSAVLQSFINMKNPKQKLAILGDMLELGEISSEEHFEIAKQACNAKLTSFFCGSLFFEHKSSFPEATFFEKKEELAAFLQKRKLESHFILLKGSRGIKLETLLDYL